MFEAFHVPGEWASSEAFAGLVRCVGSASAKQEVGRLYAELGYRGCGGDNRMARDYIVYLLRDLLDRGFEVYLSREDIQESPVLMQLFEGVAPDLLVKTRRGHV